MAIWFALLTTGVTAQMLAPKWESCFGGTDWDEGMGMILSDSTYWIVANSNSNDGDISYNHGYYDIWFLNVDEDGNFISEKTFGGSFGDIPNNIRILNDSVFYIFASTISVDGDISHNPYPDSWGSFWILQINKQGDIIWEKIAGGNGYEMTRDMTITNDGGIIAFGITTSLDGDITDHHGSWDLWMIKLDQTGQKQWDLSLGGTGLEGGGSVKQTSDGGYIVAGYTDGSGGGNYDTACNHHNPGSGFQDVWIVKLDSARNIEWQQCYGGYYDDVAFNVIALNDGYIVLAYTMSNDGDVSGYHSIPGPNSDYGGDIWVFKIDFQGNLIWQKCLGGTYNDVARNIFPTSDGGFMIVGTTKSKDGDVEGNHDLIAGWTGDIWFVKIDSTGNLLWQYCYGDIAQESLYRGVVQKSDWDYVITIGTTSSDWQCYNSAYPDVRVVELYDSTVGINETVEHTIGVKVYPNPATKLINFEYRFPGKMRSGTIRIRNTNGQLVHSIILTAAEGSKTVNVGNWKNGIYFYSITNGTKIKSGKFLKIN